MEIKASDKVCPICAYEFPETGSPYKLIALILLLVMLMYLFLR